MWQGIRISCAYTSGIRFFFSCVLRNPYCIRADETAPIRLLHSPRRSLFQMGFTLDAFWGRLDGYTGRSARTRVYERLREIARDWARKFSVHHGRREAGEGRPRRRAGGVLAGRDAKGCMNSCDVLLCILSISCRCGRRVSKWREVARIAALIHVLLCSFCKSFWGLAQRVAPAAAALWSCNQVCSTKSIRLLRYRDGSLPPWTCGYGYSLYDGSGFCKDPGPRAYASGWERTLRR